MPVKSSKMELDDDEDEQNSGDSNNQTTTKKVSKITSKPIKKKSRKLRKAFSRNNLMWVEKYRPQTLDTIISHTNIIQSINNLVNECKLPHLLFYGPPGTGKTTTILAVAKQINGPNWQSMTLELNASDERGIKVVRDRIKTFASTQQIFNVGFKLVILDEADAMTSSAQFALRRIIEKYTKNTRFCLICNYVNKIIPALQSRCTKYRFEPLNKKDIKSKLIKICKQENINNYNEGGLDSIIELSCGDMRKCINILQSTFSAYNKIDTNSVHLSTGTPLNKDIENILYLLLNKDFSEAYNSIYSIIINNGLALEDIIFNLHNLIIRVKLPSIVLCRTLKELSDLEYRLTVGTNLKIQLASLIGIFQIVRHDTFTLKKNSKSPVKN